MSEPAEAQIFLARSAEQKQSPIRRPHLKPGYRLRLLAFVLASGFAVVFVFVIQPHAALIIMFEPSGNKLSIALQLPVQLRAKSIAYQP